MKIDAHFQQSKIDGGIVRELEGDDISEHNIIASSLNLDEEAACARHHRAMGCWRT